MPLPGIFGRFTGGLFGNAMGYGVGSAMGPSLAPAVQAIANELWAKFPDRPVDLSVAAQVALKFPELEDAMKHEARIQGLDDTRWKHLKDAVSNPPGLSEMIALRQRGKISEAELTHGMRAMLLDPEWLQHLPALAEGIISPETSALLRQRGHMSQAEQHAEAALSGISAERAEKLWQGSGISMGVGEALELVRRGEMSIERFNKVIAEGDTRVEFAPDLLKLRHVPLSASVAAEARVRERTTPERALKIAHDAGLSDEDFALLVDIGARPIATGLAQEAVNRELVGPVNSSESQKFFREVVARSDVRTEYADLLYRLRVHYPSLFQLRGLIQNNAISDDLAKEYVIKQGYPHELAQGIVDAAHSVKTQKTKDLAASMIEQLYEAGLETQEWATNALVGLGYDPDEALLYLDLIDARRINSSLQAQLNVIHRSYVNHKVDRTKAMGELDSFGVGDVARDLLLESWDAERAANVIRLTNAQIGTAYKHGIITRDDAVNRWQTNGYPAEDAQVLADLAVHPNTAANPVPA